MTVIKSEKLSKDSPSKNIKKKNKKGKYFDNTEISEICLDNIDNENKHVLVTKCNKKKKKKKSCADVGIVTEMDLSKTVFKEKCKPKDDEDLQIDQNSVNDLKNLSKNASKAKNKNKRKLSEVDLVKKNSHVTKEKDLKNNEECEPSKLRKEMKKNKRKSKNDLIVEDVILNDDGNISSDGENLIKDAVNNNMINCDNVDQTKSLKRKKKKTIYDPEEWEPLPPSQNISSKDIVSGIMPDVKEKAPVNEKTEFKDKKSSKKCLSEIKNLMEDDEDDSEVRDLIYSRKKPKWTKKEKRKLTKKNNKNILGEEPRKYTTSIAIPASILEETCLLLELRTYVVGQLARIACIYSVDEIIVFNDNDDNGRNDEFMGMMKMILEYQECPQYLRKALFPYHRFMSKAGVLNPVNAPHHLLSNEWCPYREGVVEECGGPRSTVNVGLRIPVLIDRPLEAGVRVTVKFPPETKTMPKPYGIVVSPEEPREKGGLYWGYTVRIANSISEIFEGDRFPKYDLLIGTSDKGTDINSIKKFPQFSNALIVFGGVKGLENGFKFDRKLYKTEPSKFFDNYVNICPNQQSRTIRTEEAVVITLSRLSDMLSLSVKDVEQSCSSR